MIKQLENKMEHETENVDSADLIREIYELTHIVAIENNLELQLQLEELHKLAELRGVM
jgi:signal transduction histidine kinase